MGERKVSAREPRPAGWCFRRGPTGARGVAAAASVALALAAQGLAAPALGAGGDAQLRALVAHELHIYAPGVDPGALTTAQVGEIYAIMHAHYGQATKAALIRSVIGGPRYSLRGLLLGGS